MELMKRFAGWVEKNEWFPKAFAPFFGMLFCVGLGYFAAVLTNQIQNPQFGLNAHLMVLGMMIVSGLFLSVIMWIANYVDKRDGY